MENLLIMCLCNPLQRSSFKGVPLNRSDNFEPIFKVFIFHRKWIFLNCSDVTRIHIQVTFLAFFFLSWCQLRFWKGPLHSSLYGFLQQVLFNLSGYKFILEKEKNVASNILVCFLCLELECYFKQTTNRVYAYFFTHRYKMSWIPLKQM